MAGSNGKAAEPIVFFDRILEVLDYQDRPLLAFPHEQTVADFELFTGRDLNLLVNRAAKHYYNEMLLKPSEVKQHELAVIKSSSLTSNSAKHYRNFDWTI